MKMRFCAEIGFCILMVFGGLLISSRAMGASDIQFVEKAANKLFTLRSDNNGIVSQESVDMVMGLFDFDRFFQRISQDIRQEMSPDEFKKLKEVFKKLFVENMAKKGLKLSDKQLQSMRYRAGAKTALESNVILHGKWDNREVEIQFTLASVAGSWKLVDLSVEGALLSRQYRSQFNRVFRKEGFDGLIGKIEKKKASLSSS